MSRPWCGPSTNQGVSWSTPVNAAEGGDRPDSPAVAISPTGSNLDLVYDAYLQPFQSTTTAARNMPGWSAAPTWVPAGPA
jgi:hypothetical protein